MHRVWEAQSLFAAFQVLETLDLTVKGASAHRPSVVQNKWDSQLRADLEQRLLDIGIAPDETFSWAVRGPANGLEKKLNERTTASLPASWAAHNIRDQSIPYVDAINRAQWLRSNVSAHRSRGYLPKLNAVDTVNVQHLARSLLMNAVSFLGGTSGASFEVDIRVRFKGSDPISFCRIQAVAAHSSFTHEFEQVEI